MEHPGRVSDSCTVAGNYACREVAVSATGIGEDIVDGALAARLATLVDAGMSLSEASERVREQMLRRNGKAGLIAVSLDGSWVAPHTTPSMSWLARGADWQEVFDPALGNDPASAP